MTKDNNDNNEIKLGNINFDGQVSDKYSEGFTNAEPSYGYNNEKSISDNLDDIGFRRANSEAKDFSKSAEEGLVKVDFEKPDDAKVKKYTLWGAIIFCIIVAPIIYHRLHDIYLG